VSRLFDRSTPRAEQAWVLATRSPAHGDGAAALAIEGSDAALRWHASLRGRDIEVYSPDSGRGIVWVRPYASERKRRLPVTQTQTATAVELPTGRWVIDPSHTEVGFVGNGTSAVLVGDLTIKGVTRPVRLETDYLGHTVDPWGNERAVFTARGRINHEGWGLTWNMLLEAGGLVVSKEITIELDLELIKEAA
jgi:YceI-like domain